MADFTCEPVLIMAAYCVKKESDVTLTRQKRVLWQLSISSLGRRRGYIGLPLLTQSHLTVPHTLWASGSGKRDPNSFSVAGSAQSHSIRQRGCNAEQSSSGILTVAGFSYTWSALGTPRESSSSSSSGSFGPRKSFLYKELSSTSM